MASSPNVICTCNIAAFLRVPEIATAGAASLYFNQKFVALMGASPSAAHTRECAENVGRTMARRSDVDFGFSVI